MAAPGRNINTPDYMAEIVAEIVRLARRSPDVSQRSGVSVRASISGFETLTANAMRRGILAGEEQIARASATSGTSPRRCRARWNSKPSTKAPTRK